MRRGFLFLIVMSLLVWALPALGSEVVRFKSGTVLVVSQHRTDGNMIYVVLGSGNEMAFPASFVDKIESKDVSMRSGDTVYNRAISAPKGEGAVDVPGTGMDGWSTDYNSVAKFTGGSKLKHSEPLGYAVNNPIASPNTAIGNVRSVMNPALGRGSARPQDTSETGRGSQTINVSSRASSGVDKGKLSEIKPRVQQNSE